jgi:hypothetical protein
MTRSHTIRLQWPVQDTTHKNVNSSDLLWSYPQRGVGAETWTHCHVTGGRLLIWRYPVCLYRSLNVTVAQPKNCPFRVNTTIEFKNISTAYDSQGKGKAHPRTGHEGPEVAYRYSSTLSLTSALDGGGWSKPRPGRFPPRKDPVPIV